MRLLPRHKRHERTRRDAFCRLMSERDIPFQADFQHVEVQASLHLDQDMVNVLPDDLTILGCLDGTGRKLTTLPERLHVQGSLFLDNTPITALPDSLRVDQAVSLENSGITALPRGLHVQGILDLTGTPIEVLPEGLVVDDDLDLTFSRVKHLPKNLTVGGKIYASSRLVDLHAFMATQSGPVGLTMGRSHHQQLALRARLQAFPDLLKIVLSLGPEYRLGIRLTAEGTYMARFESAH